ncbi:MAG TPA: RNA polymerase sigma factor RpoD/SigA [Chitinispirillaceae bacterium]|nr:RNA polymerase sigma factor RpoD/SigA [Chitinispirillaceae bacterium]
MKRIRNREEGAREKLIKANLRFVVGVSRNYQHQGLPLCDIINEGNLGLIRASMHFDETKNFKFISYAVWWIRQGILSALAEQSRIVRLPINRSGDLYKVGKVRSTLEQRFHRSPMNSEIALEMGINEQKINDTLNISNNPVSLDAPVCDNSSMDYMDLLEDENLEKPDSRITRKSFNKAIENAIATLPQREKEIITMYYGIGKDEPATLDCIAQRYQLTRERIRQIKKNAITRLKKNTVLEHLKNSNYDD